MTSHNATKPGKTRRPSSATLRCNHTMPHAPLRARAHPPLGSASQGSVFSVAFGASTTLVHIPFFHHPHSGLIVSGGRRLEVHDQAARLSTLISILAHMYHRTHVASPTHKTSNIHINPEQFIQAKPNAHTHI